MKNIRKNIELIRKNICLAANTSSAVELMAVTKTFSYQDVLEALRCGIKHIGESRIQEALPKFERLGPYLSGVTKHFIGHLQSNKVRKAVENFDLIHSLDTINLANDISRHCKNIGKIQNCLIEVKVSQKTIKTTGVNLDNVKDFYKQCAKVPHILVKGLMVIMPCNCNHEILRVHFKQVYSLFKDIKKSFDVAKFDILSMGMSGDYKIAVEEGATMVRIGSAIFGERNYGNK